MPSQTSPHDAHITEPFADRFLLVGIDCAVDPRNIGLARASLQEGNIMLRELHERVDAAQIASYVQTWLAEEPVALIGMDAPLGWPAPLARALEKHEAGACLPQNANALFRRRCDDVVSVTLKKRPLDVGADRIARTAHAALHVLALIREQTGVAIPLAWSPGPPDEAVALEVYPGGTLKSLGLRSSAYKGPGCTAERQEMIAALREWMTFDASLANQMKSSDHLLDAAICTLAAADFVQQAMILPPDTADIRKEGWIWVRRPGTS